MNLKPEMIVPYVVEQSPRGERAYDIFSLLLKERIVNSSGAQASQMRELFQSPGGHEAIERSILTRKTSDRLVEIVSGLQRTAKQATKRVTKPATTRKRKPKAVQAAEEG